MYFINVLEKLMDALVVKELPLLFETRITVFLESLH
jgi:hypothetical protein